MKCPLGFLVTVISLHGSLAVSAGRGGVTPVQKAVQMLEGLIKKAETAKHEENVQYAGFKQFCDDVTVQKQKEIEEADEQIELLKADIEKADSEVKRLAKEIAQHEKDIAGWDVDLKAATKVRKSERSTYLEEHQDYKESIDAIAQAMIVLKQQDYDRAAAVPLGGAALTQLQRVQQLNKMPEADRRVIAAFLERTAADREDPETPDPNEEYKGTAYSFQSGGIVEMLEKLRDQFRDELKKVQAAEVDRRQAYDMLSQDLTDQTEEAKNQVEEKSVSEAKQKQLSIEKTSDLSEVTEVRKADAKYLKDLTELCTTKTTEFEARSKLRSEEIEAMEKAVEILSGDDVEGSAEKHLPTLLQASKASSFAQLRASSQKQVTNDPDQLRAAAFLKEAGDRLNSHILSAIATQAGADPFKKVKQLIEELIKRLMSQATAEATQKGWCDKEMGTNKHTRKTKTAEVDTLRSTIEGLDSDIKTLAKNLKEKHEELAELEAAVAEFTEKRNNETATNEATIKDAVAGQEALTNAIKVLEDFYAKAAKATSLSQSSSAAGGKQPAIPEIFDGPYKGMQAAKGGVIGMLEVIQSDFARLESDTKSAEAAAQSEYDEFMSDSAQTKASLDEDVKHATSTKLAKEGELGVAKDNLETAQKILDAALEAYEKLKGPCANDGLGETMSYAERKKRREDEVEALKEALRILSGDDISALQEAKMD